MRCGTPRPACSVRCRRPASRWWGSAPQARYRCSRRAARTARGQRAARRLRHQEHARVPERLVPGAELEHVACKALDRVVADLEYLPAARPESVQNAAPIGGDDRLAADDRQALADAHEDVGVIERDAVAVSGAEAHHLVVELARPVGEHLRVGARREAGISDALQVIEHQAAGALEKLSRALVMGEIEQVRDLEAELGSLPHRPRPRRRSARRLALCSG